MQLEEKQFASLQGTKSGSARSPKIDLGQVRSSPKSVEPLLVCDRNNQPNRHSDTRSHKSFCMLHRTLSSEAASSLTHLKSLARSPGNPSVKRMVLRRYRKCAAG